MHSFCVCYQGGGGSKQVIPLFSVSELLAMAV